MNPGHVLASALGTGGWRYIRIVVIIFTASAVVRLIPVRRRDAYSRPTIRPRRRRVLAALTATALAALIVTGYLLVGARPLQNTRPGSVVASGTAAAAALRPGVGVFVPGATASYRPVEAWAGLTGVRPGLVLYFSAWNDPFQVQLADRAHHHAAVPFVQMDPRGVSLASIAAGESDIYLRHFAAQVRAFRHPVAVSFAPEANGPWYSWGCGRAPASEYIAAWRRIHTIMTAAGARNIIWTWDTNRMFHGACSLAARWPGARYVDWIAVDGYWRGQGDTFATTLAPTIAAVRALAHKPVLIGETGAPDVPQAPVWVRSVFRGAERTPGVIGVVWFNYGDHLGNYRLEDDPAALTAFRAEAGSYG
jgi:mannan endo-1,4-beta-mannosidase